jgi:hypothetical protein
VPGLRRGFTRTLGVVMGEHLSYAFEDPQAVSFLAGIAEVCADRGSGMTILPITGAPDDTIRITGAAVDGYVVWTTSNDDPILAAVQVMKRPAVVHGGPAVDTLAPGEHRQPGRSAGHRCDRVRGATCSGMTRPADLLAGRLVDLGKVVGSPPPGASSARFDAVNRRRCRRLGSGHRRLYRRQCHQPEPGPARERIIAIKATIGLLPALAALIAMLIFVKYPLNDDKFRQIRDETEARKQAVIKAHHEKLEDFVTPDHTV